ncbi:hypothetical protein ACFV3R_12270 [Streptomyces sp. NPDC059740]|uniref:hypothetical protein n=1 Tax=Streptomyces sp. NPDC059740 TaxID=3346926 RepID=UPI00365231A0
MTYRRAVTPALVGGALLAALLWWAGASAHLLGLPGVGRTLGVENAAQLAGWLTPWSYDLPGASPTATGTGATGTAGASTTYLALRHTAVQIRFGALFVFFVAGTLLLLRRLPPVRGRRVVAFLMVWAWGLAAGTLAVAVSSPWWVAAQGNGSFRLLPQLAGAMSAGEQSVVVTAVAAALVTVVLAGLAAGGETGAPPTAVPARAARSAATAGTTVIALSLLVLSYQPVAAAIQTISPRIGLLSEPGDLLREWLLLGAWASPGEAPLGGWLLQRAVDVLLLVVVWWLLRRLPALLTRATVPVVVTATICATVLALLAAQLLRMATRATEPYAGLLQLAAGVVDHVPAALTCGLVAGAATALTLRLTTGQAPPAAADAAGTENAALS